MAVDVKDDVDGVGVEGRCKTCGVERNRVPFSARGAVESPVERGDKQ